MRKQCLKLYNIISLDILINNIVFKKKTNRKILGTYPRTNVKWQTGKKACHTYLTKQIIQKIWKQGCIIQVLLYDNLNNKKDLFWKLLHVIFSHVKPKSDDYYQTNVVSISREEPYMTLYAHTVYLKT